MEKILVVVACFILAIPIVVFCYSVFNLVESESDLGRIVYDTFLYSFFEKSRLYKKAAWVLEYIGKKMTKKRIVIKDIDHLRRLLPIKKYAHLVILGRDGITLQVGVFQCHNFERFQKVDSKNDFAIFLIEKHILVEYLRERTEMMILNDRWISPLANPEAKDMIRRTIQNIREGEWLTFFRKPTFFDFGAVYKTTLILKRAIN